jgi:Peptidase S24-like
MFLANMATIDDDIRLVRELVQWSGSNVAQIAKRINVANTTLNRFNKGTATSRLHRDTVGKLRAEFPEFPGFERDADLPAAYNNADYLPVDVLPSYAGMGGGGTGDGDHGQALVSRRLIEDELRADPSDMLLIEARGQSMEPDFMHGDQILIDKRDCNPVQPGSFALWDGDGYVVKLVERVPASLGRYRVFSASPRFSAYEVDADQVKIMGRPVWFGRRL